MRRVILAIVSTITGLVLLLSFKTHGAASLATPPAAVSTNSHASSNSSAGSAKSSTHKTTTTAASKTVTGDAINTQYGPVQVQVTVTSGKVVSANAVEYPMNSSLDAQINSYAIPYLNQEAVHAGTANIDMISGATYTSAGYIQSLQSALSKAGV